jgi:hypothetical protein
MLNLRALQWPQDQETLSALDMSFTTDRIYQVVESGISFALHDTVVVPALHKDYDLAEFVESLPTLDYVVVAEVDTVLAGVATLKFETWNRRAVLEHLYFCENSLRPCRRMYLNTLNPFIESLQRDTALGWL